MTQLSSALTASGLHGLPTLSWTWTDDPAAPPPFAPFLTGLDSTGATAFITPAGVTETLAPATGVTPAAN